MKIYIATSRDVGRRCAVWARWNGYDIAESMDECDIFISVMYDTLIPLEFIEKHRCYNFHPGVLPWYRGAGAYSWAIINGEFEAGVTLHQIDKDIDHGPVIDICRFPILPDDTAGSLFSKAEDVMFDMFRKYLDILISNDYAAIKQEDGRIYYRKDLEQARDLTKYIRAFTFPGKPDAYYKNSKGKICQISLE